MVLSRAFCAQIRQELKRGRTYSGFPLDAEGRRLRIAKLRRRAALLPMRYRAAELARIRELEGTNAAPSEAAAAPAESEASEPKGADDLYIMRYVGILQDVLKIGRSNNPETRRRGLEAGQNFNLELLATFPGKGYLELAVHRRLEERRSTRGAGNEWFRTDLQGALDAVARAALEHERARP